MQSQEEYSKKMKPIKVDHRINLIQMIHLMNSGMATVSSIGQMVLITKASGTLTKLKAKAPSGMQKVISIKESSRMTWLMAMASTLISMVVNTRANLEMMSKKDTEKKSGLMELNMLVRTKTA